MLEVGAPCNPEIEKCFVSDCSSEDDPECDLTPYKKVEILAKEAPSCLEEHSCESFGCNQIKSCSITYCDNKSKEEGEICTNLN